MNPLLQQIIEQEASRREIQKYALSSQVYVLVNNGAVSPNLPRTDESVSHNLYAGVGQPLKPLGFELERNLLFIHGVDAYFADYDSFVTVKSANVYITYNYLQNSVVKPTQFADEYTLSSEQVTVHEKRLEISAAFLQSKMCRVTLSGIILRPE